MTKNLLLYLFLIKTFCYFDSNDYCKKKLLKKIIRLNHLFGILRELKTDKLIFV